MSSNQDESVPGLEEDDFLCTIPSGPPPDTIVPVVELNLPVRIYVPLARAGIGSLGDLAGHDTSALRALGLTDEQIDLVRRPLREYDLQGPLVDGDE